MCGICGKINLEGSFVDIELIRKMAATLSHRGPDDEGIYIKNNVGLGHRRLSIIDLSKTAHQPMSNENGTIWIILNGEIYNFLELRKDLQNKGHRFNSKSDTEVIVHLYEEIGIDCVKYLRGMFAFAIWDEKIKRLLLARDRIGKKPLVYAIKNGSLTFASEIRSILHNTQVSRQINFKALHLYLTYQYIPAPYTIFQDINKLPPAHILVCENGEVKIQKYWSLSYKNKANIGEKECRQKLYDLLREATKIRMISDVGLGAFLSGGIDSSSIVALMSELSSRPVKTFSIGFKDESFNELKFARKVAGLFNTEHREFIVEPKASEILPELILNFGEPFSDSSVIPTYYLSKMARKDVTVALCGDGGDESFAGYERYAANKVGDIYAKVPAFIRKNIVGSILKSLSVTTKKKDLIRNLKRFSDGANFEKRKRYSFWMSVFSDRLKDEIYSESLKRKVADFDSSGYIVDLYNESDAGDFVDATLFVDVMSYLPGDLLMKVDIASMANSLEARSPFLDHELMEFAASIPSCLKLKGCTTKYILKKTLSRILPREILYRRKAGFGVPIGGWLKGELKNYCLHTLLSDRCIKRGYFKEEAIRQLLADHFSAKFDNGNRIWSLLALEVWQQLFIDNY